MDLKELQNTLDYLDKEGFISKHKVLSKEHPDGEVFYRLTEGGKALLRKNGREYRGKTETTNKE